MRILIATDAWHPQVNGVVRTLTSLARSASALGAEIDFLTPDGFPSLAVPTYPGLRVALPNPWRIAARIEAASPDAIHIAAAATSLSRRPIRHAFRNISPFARSFRLT
jgi:hypothetical protein